MISLNDYFQPLTLANLATFAGLMLFFDCVGSFVAAKLLKLSERRILHWLIGLGAFLFLWFCLGFVVVPNRQHFMVSVLILFAVTLPYYLSSGSSKSLWMTLWKLRLPLAVVALLLPAVYIKASLPPYYWDEMAYQLISPNQLKNITTWKFTGDLYFDLPRSLNNLFIFVFSITHTYSIARLMHFSILVTSLLYAYELLKKHLGFWPAFIFYFGFWSIPQDIVFTSTLGYVDVAAYSFLLIGLVESVGYLLKPSSQALVGSVVFWSLSLGTKYSSLHSFAPAMIAFILVVAIQKRLKKLLLTRNILIGLMIFVVFGGYWYVKNFVLFGNPIFPFVFPCKDKYVNICPFGSGYFEGWTYPVTIKNFRPIVGSLFNKSYMVYIALLATGLMILANKNKSTRQISIYIILAVAGEFLFIKYFSGFMIRYHQHIQLWLLLLIVVQLGNKYQSHKIGLFSRAIFVLLFLSAVVNFAIVVRFTNSFNFFSGYEYRYALGRMSIYEWVENKVPGMSAVTQLCEHPTNNQDVSIMRIDPDLIWYKPQGLIRVFLTNCNLVGETQEPSYYLTSFNNCMDAETLQTLPNYGKEGVKLMREANNKLVCASDLVGPGLYHYPKNNSEK